ncbi:hypothetical protein [Sorangium sp. So ce861]|uniref:hypothetical protein n=1 Tax=Sorangium sp. So ce861 TaxID=3133323 RepID=UPI003F63A004
MKSLDGRIPDVQRVAELVLSAAVRWTGAHHIQPQAAAGRVQELLFCERRYWECFSAGLIGADELRDVLLARLQTWIEHETGQVAPEPDLWINSHLEGAVDDALFGPDSGRRSPARYRLPAG